MLARAYRRRSAPAQAQEAALIVFAAPDCFRRSPSECLRTASVGGIQTAECLVIGEITNDTLIVVLNKVDVFPIATRNEAISKIKARVQKTLASTKFADAPMVEVAARPGGGDIHDPLATEIVPPRTAAEIGNTGGNTSDAMIAASEAHPDGDEEHVVMKDDGSAKGGIVGSSGIVGNGGKGGGPVAPLGIAELLDAIKRRVRIPHRDPDGPLLFAIDHCFPIKGQGTVLTGTVLNGSMKVGMESKRQFPALPRHLHYTSGALCVHFQSTFPS